MDKRIIIIDDEESILKSYLMILSPPEKRAETASDTALFKDSSKQESDSGHYELTTASQGEEGLEKVREARLKGHPFALAFIDVRMPPGWDGLETAKMIRETDPDIEIVIVTAYSDRERREIVDKVGAPEKLLYLKKPFDPEEIRQLALSLVRKWHIERKAKMHKEHLEQILGSVRRLKTLSISSKRETLSAILTEVLCFVGAREGLIARLGHGSIRAEVSTENLLPCDIETIAKKMADHLPRVITISQIGNIMAIPLENRSENLFILVLDAHSPVGDEQADLLSILLETSAEVLESVKKQEQFLKNENIATVGQIATGIIHEISTPLTAITRAADMYDVDGRMMLTFFDAYSELLKESELPLELRERLDELNMKFDPAKIRKKMTSYHAIIQKGAERIQNLMKNVKSFCSVTDHFELKSHDVSHGLEDILLLAHNALKYGITVHREWNRPLSAWCDISSLRQVFFNLILNAAQAMEGVGNLWITGEDAGGRLLLSIRDSGPGIPEAEKERIFEAFYTTKADGTGLGLLIAKRIIDKHHGTIQVESEPGKGTCFHIEIPNGEWGTGH